MIKISPSNVGSAGSSLVRELRSHIPPCQKKQNINDRSNTVTNSIKTLKMVHIKKKIFKKKNTFQ